MSKPLWFADNPTLLDTPLRSQCSYALALALVLVKVDDKMDTYFNGLVYNKNELENEKYITFLRLFNLKDNKKSKDLFKQLNSNN